MKRLTDIQRIIRDFLIYCARRESTITYSELGNNIGRPTRGPWTTDLDAIRENEIACGRPDLALLVVSGGTGLPKIYKGNALDPNDGLRVAMYRDDVDHVYRHWKRGDRQVSRSSEPEAGEAAAFLKEARRQSRAIAASPQEKEDQDFIDSISIWNER